MSNTKKSLWAAAEDRQLFALVSSFGPSNWEKIANYFVNRSGKQCRERWLNHVCPTVKKSPWEPEEDEKILELVAKHGTRWSVIAGFLPGRTDNAVKNRYFTFVRHHRAPKPPSWFITAKRYLPPSPPQPTMMTTTTTTATTPPTTMSVSSLCPSSAHKKRKLEELVPCPKPESSPTEPPSKQPRNNSTNNHNHIKVCGVVQNHASIAHLDDNNRGNNHKFQSHSIPIRIANTNLLPSLPKTTTNSRTDSTTNSTTNHSSLAMLSDAAEIVTQQISSTHHSPPLPNNNNTHQSLFCSSPPLLLPKTPRQLNLNQRADLQAAQRIAEFLNLPSPLSQTNVGKRLPSLSELFGNV